MDRPSVVLCGVPSHKTIPLSVASLLLQKMMAKTRSRLPERALARRRPKRAALEVLLQGLIHPILLAVRRSSSDRLSTSTTQARGSPMFGLGEANLNLGDRATPRRAGTYGNASFSEGSRPASAFRSAGDTWPTEHHDTTGPPLPDLDREDFFQAAGNTPEPEIPTKISRGTFGMHLGSASGGWTSPTTQGDEPGRVVPVNSCTQSSPLAEDFPPDFSGMFSSSFSCEDPPPFRSSWGAFGPMFTSDFRARNGPFRSMPSSPEYREAPEAAANH